MDVYHVRSAADGFVSSFTYMSEGFAADLPPNALADVQTMVWQQMMCRGTWGHEVEPCVAMLVDVRKEGRKASRTYWLRVDNPMAVAAARFLPVEKGVDRPWPDANWITPASRAHVFLEVYLAEYGDAYDECFPGEVVDSLLSKLCEGAAWSDHLFLRPVAILGPEEDGEPGDLSEEEGETPEVLLAYELTFMDGSMMFITPQGPSRTFQYEMGYRVVHPKEFGHAVLTSQLQ